MRLREIGWKMMGWGGNKRERGQDVKKVVRGAPSSHFSYRARDSDNTKNS